MRGLIVIYLTVLLTGCAIAPEDHERYSQFTPGECRSYGVDVREGDQITGEVVEAMYGTMGTVYKYCHWPDGSSPGGCARPADTSLVFTEVPAPSHKYIVVIAELDYKFCYDCCGMQHEYCHALYETRWHTKRWDMPLLFEEEHCFGGVCRTAVPKLCPEDDQ